MRIAVQVGGVRNVVFLVGLGELSLLTFYSAWTLPWR
jgi:hypothetical protein